MDTFTQRVLTNIEAIRKATDRSQKSVYEGAGIPGATFDRKINRTGKFDLQELGAIAETLGVSPMDLLTDDLASVLARISNSAKAA